MSAVPEPDDRLSLAEVDGQLRGLPAAENKRALRTARFLALGLTGWAPEDLLQEAQTQLLGGERRWPRGVPAIIVIQNAMESIASNERKRVRKGPIDEFVEVSTVDLTDVEDGQAMPVTGSVTATPQDFVDWRQQLAAVEAAVKGDEDVEMLLLPWADKTHGAEAAADLGWDMKKYEAARKRLNRRLESLGNERSEK